MLMHNAHAYIIRPPGTSVPDGLMFYPFIIPLQKLGSIVCSFFYLFYVIFAVLQLELRVVGLSITVSMSENGFWCILSLKEFYTPDNNKLCICEIFVRPFV